MPEQTSWRSLWATPTEYVRGLKLIDCTTHTVVTALSGMPYVTLSYVWGAATKENLTGDPKSSQKQMASGILTELSAVILDATQVTRALGYGYLWVDRYCIDQSDPREMHNQISRMDLIYSNSEVTIVAAAGIDESAGLPGVGARRQKPADGPLAWEPHNPVNTPPSAPHHQEFQVDHTGLDAPGVSALPVSCDFHFRSDLL